MKCLYSNIYCFRYAGSVPPTMPTCNHNGKTFWSAAMTPKDVKKFHEAFYSSSSKVTQDCLILKYCSTSKPQSGRSLKGGSWKGIAAKYHVKSVQGYVVQVCQKTFLNILHISKNRIQHVCRRHLETSLAPKELRGGDKISHKNNERKQAAINFISSFKVLEVHYCRNKTAKRHGRLARWRK